MSGGWQLCPGRTAPGGVPAVTLGPCRSARLPRSRPCWPGGAGGQNITALDDAVALPILRPLIGLDKNEIIAEARAVIALAISELPDEDCCSLLRPRPAETKARIADLRRIEARVDADDLAEELAAAVQEYSPGRA